MEEPKEIVGYRIRKLPSRPEMKVIEIVTTDGDFAFVGSKAIFLRLSESLAMAAQDMPPVRTAH